jgi:hypothetical protein
MSDIREAVAEAKARWKRVAAGHLVRKEELEAIIAGGGPGAEAAAAELAVVNGQLQTARDELKALDRLAAEAPAHEARAIRASIDGDPLIQSHEDRALDSARGYIKEMDAQVRLNTEMSDLDAELEGELEGKPAPVVAPKSKEERDADAREAFEKLRNAKPKKTL